MKKIHLYLIFASLLFPAGGISLFLSLYLRLPSFSMVNHSFQINIIHFLFFFGVGFFILSAGLIILSRVEGDLFPLKREALFWRNLISYLPFCLFLLSPLLLLHYLEKDDLRARLQSLGISVLICFLYFRLSSPNTLEKILPYKKWLSKFQELSLRKRILTLFLVSFFIYNLCALVLVSKGITFSGDEPYYLLTTHSLYKDHDIDVSNNYENRDYFNFYSKKENPRLVLGKYAREGRKKNTLYPINLPGISVLMLPYYGLSQLAKGKILTFILKGSLSIWASLLGIQFYLLALELWQKRGLSLLLWFFYSFSSPILFYAIHLYPEIPVAFLSLYAFRKIRSRAPLSWGNYLLLGFSLSLLPWFGLKYQTIFWPLFFIFLYIFFKENKSGKKALLFPIFPLFSLTSFYFFLFKLYGSFSPFSVYEGTMTPEKTMSFLRMAWKLPLGLRIDSFLDYFLDQRDGLLLYSPFYFFSFLGLIELRRKSSRDFLILLFLSLPFILNYAFFTHRQGYCPQGRVLTPISWVGAVLVGYFLVENRRKIFSLFFKIMNLGGIVITGMLISHPDFLYQPTTHEVTTRAADLFIHLSNLYFFIPSYLPSFIKTKNIGYLPNYVWLILIILWGAAYARTKKDIQFKPQVRYFSLFILLLVFFLLWVLFPQLSLYPVHTFHYSAQKSLAFYTFPMGKGVILKKEGELYLHRDGSFKIPFNSKKEIEKMKLTFGSESGEYRVELFLFDIPVFKGRTLYEKRKIILTPPKSYPYRKFHLYELNLKIKKLSSESMLIDPYFLEVVPLK